jgi:Tfp pilus assembly protein PilN
MKRNVPFIGLCAAGLFLANASSGHAQTTDKQLAKEQAELDRKRAELDKRSTELQQREADLDRARGRSCKTSRPADP